MPKTIFVNRAEIAGRAHLRSHEESNYQLAREYGIGETTVRDITKEYIDKRGEAIAAAEKYYQTHQRPTQPLASSGNAALRLQWAQPAGNLHATLPPGATNLVGVAAWTMPAALQGPSNPFVHHDQFMSMAAHLISRIHRF